MHGDQPRPASSGRQGARQDGKLGDQGHLDTRVEGLGFRVEGLGFRVKPRWRHPSSKESSCKKGLSPDAEKGLGCRGRVDPVKGYWRLLRLEVGTACRLKGCIAGSIGPDLLTIG